MPIARCRGGSISRPVYGAGLRGWGLERERCFGAVIGGGLDQVIDWIICTFSHFLKYFDLILA